MLIQSLWRDGTGAFDIEISQSMAFTLFNTVFLPKLDFLHLDSSYKYMDDILFEWNG